MSEPDSTKVAPLSYQSNLDFTATVCGFNSLIPALTKTQASLALGKFLFTLPHLFSYLGEEEKLEACLKLNPAIKTDAFGNSPIFYSLKKKSQPCTDLLLKYLIKVSETSKNYLSTAYSLRKDMIGLLYNSSTLLPNFLDTLLVIQCKEFGVPKSKLAIVNQSNIQKIYPADFLKENDRNLVSERTTNQELQLSFSTTAFKFPTTLGSASSLNFLQALLNCYNKKIFKSPIVQQFIRLRWANI